MVVAIDAGEGAFLDALKQKEALMPALKSVLQQHQTLDFNALGDAADQRHRIVLSPRDAITTATANDPSAGPRNRNSVRGAVLAKREPVTAPMPITAAPATHQATASPPIPSKRATARSMDLDGMTARTVGQGFRWRVHAIRDRARQH